MTEGMDKKGSLMASVQLLHLPHKVVDSARCDGRDSPNRARGRQADVSCDPEQEAGAQEASPGSGGFTCEMFLPLSWTHAH
jgi:hypothetical protein